MNLGERVLLSAIMAGMFFGSTTGFASSIEQTADTVITAPAPQVVLFTDTTMPDSGGDSGPDDTGDTGGDDDTGPDGTGGDTGCGGGGSSGGGFADPDGSGGGTSF